MGRVETEREETGHAGAWSSLEGPGEALALRLLRPPGGPLWHLNSVYRSAPMKIAARRQNRPNGWECFSRLPSRLRRSSRLFRVAFVSLHKSYTAGNPIKTCKRPFSRRLAERRFFGVRVAGLPPSTGFPSIKDSQDQSVPPIHRKGTSQCTSFMTWQNKKLSINRSSFPRRISSSDQDGWVGCPWGKSNLFHPDGVVLYAGLTTVTVCVGLYDCQPSVVAQPGHGIASLTNNLGREALIPYANSILLC